LIKSTRELRKFLDKVKISDKIDDISPWIEANLPKFIYFNDYHVIESAIHIPTFILEMKQNPLDTRIRTTKCLFKHVGIDIEEIQRLDPTPTNPNRPVEDLLRLTDERHVKMSSASEDMTEKFSDQKVYCFFP